MNRDVDPWRGERNINAVHHHVHGIESSTPAVLLYAWRASLSASGLVAAATLREHHDRRDQNHHDHNALQQFFRDFVSQFAAPRHAAH